MEREQQLRLTRRHFFGRAAAGIGTLLGQNGINIARMQFGREKQGGMAMSIVSIDSPVSDGLMAKIKLMPNVLSVKLIKI